MKRFNADYKMTKRSSNKLLATAQLALRSSNIRHWHLVVIEDQEQLQRIRKAARNQQAITDASLLIILCTDLMAWEGESFSHWHPPYNFYNYSALPESFSSRIPADPQQHDAIMRSCGIVAQTLIMTARAMDLDACLIDGFDEEGVGEQINLPENHAVCMLIPIGQLEEAPSADTTPANGDEVFIKERF